MRRKYKKIRIDRNWSVFVYWLGSSIDREGRLAVLNDLECFISFGEGTSFWKDLTDVRGMG